MFQSTIVNNLEEATAAFKELSKRVEYDSTEGHFLGADFFDSNEEVSLDNTKTYLIARSETTVSSSGNITRNYYFSDSNKKAIPLLKDELNLIGETVSENTVIVMKEVLLNKHKYQSNVPNLFSIKNPKDEVVDGKLALMVDGELRGEISKNDGENYLGLVTYGHPGQLHLRTLESTDEEKMTLSKMLHTPEKEVTVTYKENGEDASKDVTVFGRNYTDDKLSIDNTGNYYRESNGNLSLKNQTDSESALLRDETGNIIPVVMKTKNLINLLNNSNFTLSLAKNETLTLYKELTNKEFKDLTGVDIFDDEKLINHYAEANSPSGDGKLEELRKNINTLLDLDNIKLIDGEPSLNVNKNHCLTIYKELTNKEFAGFGFAPFSNAKLIDHYPTGENDPDVHIAQITGNLDNLLVSFPLKKFF
uniref:Uncharacterized protein n=1 Tax=viral metagenome TaxID=1070528 RepID=A0A6C0LYN7_9ZZZZ